MRRNNSPTLQCIILFLKGFFDVPHLAANIRFLFLNEPGLGTGIDPGMAMTQFPAIVRLDKIR